MVFNSLNLSIANSIFLARTPSCIFIMMGNIVLNVANYSYFDSTSPLI